MQLFKTNFLKISFKKEYDLLQNSIEIGHISMLKATKLTQSQDLSFCFRRQEC